MLAVAHLQKRFGDRVAIDDVSFEVRAGETVGLLGPGGAGKSTTLALSGGLAPPDGGSVTFQGQNLRRNANPLKLRVGLVPQDLALYDELSARANLELFGGLYGLSGSTLAARADNAPGSVLRSRSVGFVGRNNPTGNVMGIMVPSGGGASRFERNCKESHERGYHQRIPPCPEDLS